MPAEHDRIATLRQAAAAKRDAAVARAETGIRALTKTSQPVTFRAVAAAGGVSVDFLTVLPAAAPAQAAYAKWGWHQVAQKRNPLPGSPLFDVLIKQLPQAGIFS